MKRVNVDRSLSRKSIYKAVVCDSVNNQPFAEVHHRRAQKLEPFAEFPTSVGGPAECADLGVEVCFKKGIS